MTKVDEFDHLGYTVEIFYQVNQNRKTEKGYLYQVSLGWCFLGAYNYDWVRTKLQAINNAKKFIEARAVLTTTLPS